MTTREVADRLKITPRQVARLVPAKIKPAYTVPGATGPLLFDPKDVERLEADRAS